MTFQATYESLNLLFVVISFFVLTFSAGIGYITRKLWYATEGASYFWMFLSAFTGTLAIYAAANFAEATVLANYAVPLRAIQDVALVGASVYAFVSAIFIRRMFEDIAA